MSVESGSIKVCGVIGDPIAHSLSPALHQYAYARLGIADQYCYSAFRVESHELAAAIAGVHALGLRGLSCTMPHKSSVLQHLDELDPAAEAIGAVNTIVNERGVLKGYNSDWIGIRDPLTARFDLEGRSVAILGAGGAARAACYALQQIGALPVVYNRTLETAAKLARAFGARAFELKSDSVFEGCCVVINATSAGMYPEASVSPVSAEQLNGVELVFDLVYKPKETEMLRMAREKEIEGISGLEMFASQAQRQVELFTGESVELDELLDFLNGLDQ